MKSILLITLLAVSLFAKAQGYYGFTNSGFENWTNNTTLSDWTLAGGSITKVLHVKDGASGGALKNETASAGKLTMSFPFVTRVTRALFDYKFVLGSATATDTCSVDIMLTRWNATNSTREIVARIIRNGTITDFSWQTFSFPFTYFSTSTPDSCFIIASSSINSGYNTNTTLYLDNFAFPAPTGVNTTPAKGLTTSIYPNPVKDQAKITFQLLKDSKVTINISDITGKVVASYNFEKAAGVHQEQLSFEALKSGIYFYEVKTAEEVKTGKFTISK